MSENSDEAETVQLKAEVPKHLKEQVKSDLGYGGIKKVVVDKLKEIARGQTVEQAERENAKRLEGVLEGYDKMMARAEQYDGVMDELATELRRDAIASVHAVARKNHEQMADAQAEIQESIDTEYETVMDKLEDSLDDGQRVWESHGQVEEAAKTKGVGFTPADVIAELKERKPDLPDERFEEGTRYESHESADIEFSSTGDD